MGKLDSPLNESSSLLGSAVSPPPYTIVASQYGSSSTSPSAPPQDYTPSAPQQPLYPSLPPTQSFERAPTPQINPSYSLPYAGPSPITSLPPPVLLLRRRSHRAADARARWRIFWALVLGSLIWSLCVNLATADELRGVRREIKKDAMKVWRWIKQEWEEAKGWESEHHVKERVGDKWGKIFYPGPSDPTMTIFDALPAATPSASSTLNLAALD